MRTSLSPCPKIRPTRRHPLLALAATVATVAATVLAGPGVASAAPVPGPSTAAPAVSAPTPGPSTAAPAAASPAPAPAADETPTTPKAPAPKASAAGETPRPAKTGARATGTGCGGELTFGEVESCPAIVDEQENVWTVRSTVDWDILIGRLSQVSGDGVGARVTDPNGTYVCYLSSYAGDCQLGAAGTYTITASLHYGSGSGSYTLSVESKRTPSECDTLPANFFSFASAGRTGTLAAGVAAICFKFTQPVGTVLHLAEPGNAGDVQGEILDGQYQPMGCPVRDTTQCTLSQPGPYRLFLQSGYGTEASYTLRMPRISNAVGCPAIPLAGFGDPGAAVKSATVAWDGVTCHALTTTTAGAVTVRFSRHQDQHLTWTMYDVAGQRICDEYTNSRHCPLPGAGSYTVLVHNHHDFGEAITYQVAVAALHHDAGCVGATGTAWDQPALLVHQTSGVQTNCQPFQGEAGDRVIAYGAPTAYNDLSMWLVDQAGTPLCTEWSEEDGCVLPATGTYRVVSYLANWESDSTDLTYRLQVRRLSAAVGCPTVVPGSYGAAPAGALGGIRCRTLDVPAAGAYLVRAVHAANHPEYAQVYDAAGLRVCGGVHCQFDAPGRYTMVLAGNVTTQVIDNDVEYAVALLPKAPAGCVPVSDAHGQAPHQGTFAAAGQYDCLQLPSPAGSRVVRLQAGDATGAANPEITVVDATGAYVCDIYSLRQYSCELTGTAPFSAVLNAPGGSPTGPYAVGFARVDGPPACPVLPRDATGATVTTAAGSFAACFAVPADQHAARESFTWTRTSGTGDARLSVFDAAGVRYCGPSGYSVERTITCTLPAGPVTVLLEADGVDATYRLTHRDAATPAT
ncbi:hypothetical protein [Micromonospora sp. NPDC023644]|uniref:hypothetical protein n=1 Tax=Micromonospora sp. NPDC023644 TaxID=3154321 RepID=UPI0033E883CD